MLWSRASPILPGLAILAAWLLHCLEQGASPPTPAPRTRGIDVLHNFRADWECTCKGTKVSTAEGDPC